jgi:hypothetical protein
MRNAHSNTTLVPIRLRESTLFLSNIVQQNTNTVRCSYTALCGTKQAADCDPTGHQIWTGATDVLLVGHVKWLCINNPWTEEDQIKRTSGCNVFIFTSTPRRRNESKVLVRYVLTLGVKTVPIVFFKYVKLKMKHFHYRPGQALRAQGGWGS